MVREKFPNKIVELDNLLQVSLEAQFERLICCSEGKVKVTVLRGN